MLFTPAGVQSPALREECQAQADLMMSASE
ncbi:hypothetical protein AGR5A_Lc50018 [Agrobacterium genomosp. 5 str. CFBP 6626]|nr:hypothetical protein AGR5A_Lc50018 [Agrobacterium genomosp. 5 str. CFBP 6626]